MATESRRTTNNPGLFTWTIGFHHQANGALTPRNREGKGRPGKRRKEEMKTLMTRGLLVAAVALCVAGSAHAATDPKTVTVSATVNAKAKLTLSQSTLTFADADPTATPSITATEGAVNVTVASRTSTSGAVTLTVLAGGDLVSGSDSIGINNITWGASGGGFVGGTLNKTTAQSVGSWTGSGSRSGTVTHALANSYSYATGSYTASITYTLTAP